MILKAVKNKLKITCDDEDEDLEESIEKGKNYLQNDIAGMTLDFEGDISAKALLINYCRYDYNNAIEYFEENFKRDLLRLQLKSAVNKNEN